MNQPLHLNKSFVPPATLYLLVNSQWADKSNATKEIQKCLNSIEVVEQKTFFRLSGKQCKENVRSNY